MAEAKGLPADELRAISDRVLQFSEADHCRVRINSGWRGYTRVATNRITSAGGSDSTFVDITSIFGKRVASVGTNRLDDSDLLNAVRRSEQMARLVPENPEYLPELGPQRYQSNAAYYPETGELEPATRAEAAAIAIDRANTAGQIVSSYMDVRAGISSIGTSNGLFGSHSSTAVAYTLTSRSPDGLQSGWAGDEANNWNNIESQRIADDAVRKCRDWRKTPLDPGEYTVILEPTAMGMLMLRMMNSFNRRTADEGRSYFSNPNGGNRIGEQLFDERVSFWSDPAFVDSETAPFNSVGQPLSRQSWVENGRLVNLACSRFWAQRLGVEALPGPSNFIMQGGDNSLEEMIASTKKGVLLTRFWYIRGLNPRIISYTGLSRDGTFLIEDGKIARPVTNFRFNQSLVSMLENVEMVGPAVRVAASENSSVNTAIVVPPVKASGFNLSSVSDAI